MKGTKEMKKITKLMAVAACLMMITTGCSNNSSSSQIESSVAEEKSPLSADITKKVMEEIEFPSMAEVSSDRLATYYDISADDIEEFSLYICGSGAYPDEIAVFKMKDTEKAEAVKALSESRKEKLVTTFTDYTPEEMYKLDDAVITVKGNYAIFVVCADNTKAKEIIDGCF